jgi:hypothetical protein
MAPPSAAAAGRFSMSRAATVVQMIIRGSGLVLILLGIAIWTGKADGVIPIHKLFGFILVLALWALAFLAARAGVSMGWIALAVVWGLVAPILGLTQDTILVGSWHWTIQILHLLIGLGAIGQGEILGRQMKRVGTTQMRPA